MLVYDGACPFCDNYARLVRLRRGVGDLVLVDARGGDPLVAELAAQGFDVDEGMALLLDGRVHHGDKALHRLALLGTRSDLFNRLNHRIFRSPRLARLLYPALRCGRNAALALLGRRRIGKEGAAS